MNEQTLPREHSTLIVLGDAGLESICSCGWRSFALPTRQKAADLAAAHKRRIAAVGAREIKVVKDPANSGYAHAFVATKPWTAFVDRKKLADRRGRPRRFSTERAAIAAARRSAS